MYKSIQKNKIPGNRFNQLVLKKWRSIDEEKQDLCAELKQHHEGDHFLCKPEETVRSYRKMVILSTLTPGLKDGCTVHTKTQF